MDFCTSPCGLGLESWWEGCPWSAADMRGSSKGLSLCHVETVRATHTAVCWEMGVYQRGSTGTGESDLPPGHLRGRNPLGHTSSIWLLLNCSAETSIILYVTHIRMWQLGFGMCSSADSLLTLPWTGSSIRPISSFRVVWIKHGHTNLMYTQHIWKSGVKVSFSKATSWEFLGRTQTKVSINFTHILIIESGILHTPVGEVYLCSVVHVVHADEAFTVLFMMRIIVSQQGDEPDREGFLIQLRSYHSRLNQIRTRCNFNGESALQFN